MKNLRYIEVTILGQKYRLAVQPASETVLREAVERVDAEMTKARASGTVRGHDRIAVLAALSLASDLIKLQNSVRFGEAFPADEIKKQLTCLNRQVGDALGELEKAEKVERSSANIEA